MRFLWRDPVWEPRLLHVSNDRMIGKIPVKFITHLLVFASRSSPNKRIAATFCGHFNRPVPITDKADIYALFWNVRSYIVSFTLAFPCVHTLVRYAQILIRKMRPIIVESKRLTLPPALAVGSVNFFLFP